MTQDEVLIELETKGIIVCISDDYLITEKYKDLLTTASPIKLQEPPRKLNVSVLLSTTSNGNEWPIQLTGSTGFERAVNFCDLCEVPRFAAKGYALRGMNHDSINVLGNIMVDDAICPTTFIDSIKVYYKYSEMPKGLKNLILEGTVFEIYKEHIAGKLINSLTGGEANKGNQIWG